MTKTYFKPHPEICPECNEFLRFGEWHDCPALHDDTEEVEAQERNYMPKYQGWEISDE